MSELHEAGELDELREYLEEEYETAYEELVATLSQDHPTFWDEENDRSKTRSTSANSMASDAQRPEAVSEPEPTSFSFSRYESSS